MSALPPALSPSVHHAIISTMKLHTNPDKASRHKAMAQNSGAMTGHVDDYLAWNLSVFGIAPRKRILDLGCGPGSYFNAVMQLHPVEYCMADNSDEFRAQAATLAAGHPECSVAPVDLTDLACVETFSGRRFDHVLLLDVLEHLEDDRNALRIIAEIVRRTGSGMFLLRVPAMQFAYGENDRAIGHYRRYSRQGLRQLLAETGFSVESIQYQNFLGLLPWIIIGRILKRGLAVSSGEGKLFNALVPILKAIEGATPPPIGLSLYAICRVKEAHHP